MPGDATRAIHHGDSFAAETGTVMPPIYATSTFAHGNPGGFDYTRSGNPNFRILEGVLASVETCEHATVFGSGVSAITAIASTLSQGDLVLCEENLYGCTVRLFEQVFAKFGVRTEWVDFTDPTALTAIESRQPAMVWLESPTNPLLKVIDLAAVCGAAKSAGVPVVVDNTFATHWCSAPSNWEPPCRSPTPRNTSTDTPMPSVVPSAATTLLGTRKWYLPRRRWA